MTATFDARALAARDWASAQLGLSAADFAPASADASFRRYFRLRATPAAGLRKSWIVMDAPPPQEDCRPFVHVAGLLAAAGVHVPEILAMDFERGFLLLSDLGAQTYLDVLQSGTLPATAPEALFADARAALLDWQAASRPGVLPDYDAALLARELQLFPDWYLGRHLGLSLSAAEAQALDTVNQWLIEAALAQPRGFVHRDFMPRNLMHSMPNPGVLDFQDAVYGPLAYDAISLYKDAFLSWPAAFVDAQLRRYHAEALQRRIPLPDWATFRRDCDLIGLQRHLKVLGIFARIRYRDGKPKYLADTPRFLRYVMEVVPQYRELAPLQALFETRVLPLVQA